MKKRDVFLSVLAIILLAIVVSRLNLTGFLVLEDKQTEVIRLIETNESESLTYVQIAIISSENVIAIQENLSNCSVLKYFLIPEIDIFEFNENEVTWILANQSSSLNVELSYTIPADCSVINGFYYVVNENETLESYGISSEENQTENQPQPPSGPSGGGSSGAIITPTPQLTSQPITQASDRREYNELKQEAEEKVKKNLEARKNPQANSYYSLLFIVLTIVALGIIIFFIISFARKPN